MGRPGGAGEARLLALIGELDAREAWAQPGFLSCAHWLSWRIGLGPRAARERVRVARALRELPQTTEMFSRGQLSWTQVRAICRVAVAADEHIYVDVATHASGGQLERLVRGVRRARKPAEDTAAPDRARYLMRSTVRYDGDGTMVITVKLPASEGAVVLAAIDAARQQLDADHADGGSAEPTSPQGGSAEPRTDHVPVAAGVDSDVPTRASIAEGLVRVAQTALANDTKSRSA